MRKTHILIAVIAAAMALSSCGKRDKDVQLARFKKSSNGPDEFTILPTKPLQAPESFSALPAPSPGESNLVDPNPKADGIAALGGNPASLARGTAPSDAGLVNHARRHGVTPGIRQTLAAEDLTIRRKHGKVNILRIGPTDDYTNAYKRQWLDAHAEKQRLERRGVATPSAPPAPK